MVTNSKNTTDIPKKRFGLRALLAALSLFLGLSLTLGSLCSAAGRWAFDQDTDEWWQTDFQQTPAFRAAVSDYLESFLTLGAGGELPWSWYSSDTLSYSSERTFTIFDSATTTEAAMAETENTDSNANPDADYESQKNILYRIIVDGETKYASDDWQSGILTGLDDAPEGFTFVLRFADGKVQIQKDGNTLDVYGNGVYDENSLWLVPGYENFPAGEGVESVEVIFAIRQTPIRFMQTNYQNRKYTNADRLYWLYQDYQQSRAAWKSIALTFAAGLLLLLAAIALRRFRPEAEQRLARLTPYVFTEFRALAVGLSFGWMAAILIVTLITNAGDLLYASENEISSQAARLLLRCLGAAFSQTWALLLAVWSLRLIGIDHRYHPESDRKSLIRMLTGAIRKKELKYPLQKRLYRMSLWRTILPLVIALATAGGTLLIYYIEWDLSPAHLILWLSLFALTLLLKILWLRRDRALARDFGRLADQVKAVQGGELTDALPLPEESDLHETAERLNDIQAGLNAAVKEQTRSERMKVELISNVSHDLKTPLTSILSYSELLLQEDLDGAAKDYAVIIEQKAQRLKTMVQDVFEVSKATSDQLPIELETLDFAKLLRQTLADMDDTITQSGLQFRLDLPDAPVLIQADGKRLYRVFQNLIQNALRYSLPGSRVYLSLKTAQNHAEATLRNTSSTELPADVDFTARFVRADESRTDGGSGLGLSIAKSFTEACGGSFHVETVADLFTVRVRFQLT